MSKLGSSSCKNPEPSQSGKLKDTKFQTQLLSDEFHYLDRQETLHRSKDISKLLQHHLWRSLVLIILVVTNIDFAYKD